MIQFPTNVLRPAPGLGAAVALYLSHACLICLLEQERQHLVAVSAHAVTHVEVPLPHQLERYEQIDLQKEEHKIAAR